MNPAAPRGASKSKRPTVDIYFVLYLTAVVLLLGTIPLAQNERTTDLESAVVALIGEEFSLEVDKIGLFVPYQPAGSVDLDIGADTVNEVRAVGNVEQVRFHLLSILDTAAQDGIPIEQGRLVPTSDRSVQFRWTRSINERPGSYLVEIEGETTSRIPASITDPVVRKRIASVLEDRGPLRDTARFVINVLAVEDLIAAQQAQRPPTFGPDEEGPDSGSIANPLTLLRGLGGGGSFVAGAVAPIVFVNRDGSWKQTISIAGIDPNKLKVRTPDDVTVFSRGSRQIHLSGRGPAVGERRRVSVSIEGNGTNVPVDFWVESRDLGSIALPRSVVRGSPYTIDLSGSESIDRDRIAVTVYENDERVLSNQPSRFTYRPVGSGSGKFEVKIDGRIVDTRPFSIVPIPDPVIHVIDARDASGAIILETRTRGHVRSRPNLAIVRIQKNQNADEATPIGEPSIDPATKEIRQRWMIRRRNTDQTGKTVIAVWDQRGMSVERTVTVPDPLD